MTESQVLQSTKALNAVESSHPGKIPQTILSTVQPGGDKHPAILKKKHVPTIHSKSVFQYHEVQTPFFVPTQNFIKIIKF